jgi:DnaJ family protein C protein 11
LEPSKLDPDDFINVTVPLQMLVVDSHLWLAPNSKAQLLGFYDVAIGSGKILRVEYSFKGIAHQVIIRDDQELLLPLRRHIIE